MRYTTLGHSGIKISKLCLGGMSFGEASPDFHQWTIGPEETRAVIKRALDHGVNFIDTANCYSFGTSEEYIGRALRIHRFDYDTPIEETMEALDKLVRTGKVRALGASAMYAYQLHNMQVAAEKNGWTKFASMQCHYNLLYREDERETIPVCRQYDMAVTPYSPMASGHLTRPTWESSSVRGTTDTTMVNKYDHDRIIDMPVIERVAKVAADHGVPMAQVALAWHWARGVESPIVGCSKPERVDDAVAALDLGLSPAEVDFLEELYQPHNLVGPKGRPGDKPLAGTTKVKLAR